MQAIGAQQSALVSSLVNNGCQPSLVDIGPTNLLPVQAAKFQYQRAQQHLDGAPNSNPGSNCRALVPLDQPSVSAEAQHRRLSNFASALSAGGVGLLGLGDKSFGLSRAIVQEADSKPGFVKNHNNQFVNAYSGVIAPIPLCPRRPNTDQPDLTPPVQSCQELYRSFCEGDITNRDRYEIMMETQRNIVRFIKGKRTVKMGKHKFIGPDVKYPILCFKTGNGATTEFKTFVMDRVVFKPLECEWVRCALHLDDSGQLDSGFYATMMFKPWTNTDRLAPDDQTMCELAKWFSDESREWVCKLIYYSPTCIPAVKLVVSGEQSCCTDWCNVEYAFKNLVPKKETKAADDTDALNAVRSLLGHLKPKPVTSKSIEPASSDAGPSRPCAQPPASTTKRPKSAAKPKSRKKRKTLPGPGLSVVFVILLMLFATCEFIGELIILGPEPYEFRLYAH